MFQKIKNYIELTTESAPLVVFRIGFGLLMLFSIIRFWAKGWIETLYILPQYHFSYYGFEWVKPYGNFTYLVFFICGVAALFIALGYKYRMAIIAFFLSFSYIELMDKTTYLNHYYFIIVLSFLLICLPANSSFSLDSYRKKIAYAHVPKWTIDSLKLLIAIVYIYAGIAKINPDWLLKGSPLNIWLPSKYDLPFIGNTLMQEHWFHLFMSWAGMLYDISIPFLLLYKRTRVIGFGLVVIFHIFTSILFPIGVFPYIMIFSSLIFFDASFHNKILAVLRKVFVPSKEGEVKSSFSFAHKKIVYPVVVVFFVIQGFVPLRNLCYSSNLFWSEEGFRFSWRVMLMEKMGYTTFKIEDRNTGKSFVVRNEDYLTPFQERQMSFQPDFILEFSHFLGAQYKEKGYNNIAVYAESYVALNGRPSKQFINPHVNLLEKEESFKPKNWILPF